MQLRSADLKRRKWLRMLRRLAVIAGITLTVIAVIMFLSIGVSFDGHNELIDGCHNTSGVLLPLGLFVLGMLCLSFGYP